MQTHYVIKKTKAGIGNRILNLIDAIAQVEHEKKPIVTRDVELGRYYKSPANRGRPIQFNGNLLLSETLYRENPIKLEEYFYTTPKNEIINNSIAIHFRGRDFAKWKAHSIIPKNFFIEQIESIAQDTFLMLFTDDPLHETVVSIEDYIKIKRRIYYKFQGSSHSDFSLLSRASRIIASPSTFSLCAALFGGQQIVMPKCYAEHEARIGAEFWRRLISGEPTKYIRVDLT